MKVVIEASPIAFGYENPLAETGITRVIKNLLVKIDDYCSENETLFLFSQENLWCQFLLNKYIYQTNIKRISPLINNILLQYHSEYYYTKDVADLVDVKRDLESIKFSSDFLEVLAQQTSLFHSHFLPAPDVFRKQCRVVFTVHDIFPLTHNTLFDDNVATFYRNYIKSFGFTDVAACVSDYTAHQVKSYLPQFNKGNVRTIYNAADNSAFSKHVKTEVLTNLSLEAEHYFLCVSTLEPRKNFPSIIRAFNSYLQKSKIKRKLVLVGSVGWLSQAETEKIDELVKSNDIVLAGRVNDSDLHELLKHAFVFLSGSFCEGFGLGALEAAMQGTLPLVAANTAQKEVMNDFGMTLDSWVPSAISEKLLEIENSPMPMTKTNNREVITNKYSWASAALKYVELYREMSES